MPKLQVKTFSGMTPKVDDHMLPENGAALAENCKLTNGTLRAYRQPALTHTLPTTADSIHLYRDADQEYWFSFAGEVDVVNSPIADDANNRVYMTGHPKGARFTDNILALTGGTDYPVNTQQLGMPEPDKAPVVTVEGLPEGIDAQGLEENLSDYDSSAEGFTYYATDTKLVYTRLADDEADPDAPKWDDGKDWENDFFAEYRFYVTTWVTEDGKEGPPSLPSGEAYWKKGQSIKLEVDDSPGSVDLNITHFRVYVTRGDGYWWLCEAVKYGEGEGAETVTDVPVGQTVLYDETPAEDRRSQLVTTNWLAPPTDLKGLTLLPYGTAAGFKGKELYFTEPYHLYAWPPQYRLTMEYDIVAIVAAGNSLIITTKGNPYICFGTEPAAMTLERIDASQVCTSKRSMVDMGYQAMYASPDGLCAIASGSPQLVTANVINPEDWRANYHPEQIHAYFHDGKYYGFHNAGGFIFDTQTGSLTNLSTTASSGFADLETDSLYIHTDDKISQWDAGTDKLRYRWKSRDYQGTPIKLNSARIQAASYDDLRFKLYRDGVEVMNIAVLNDKGFRLPMGIGSSWQYELSGTDTVYCVTLASSMSEL